MDSSELNYPSGKGKGTPIPPEIRGWNWGAFCLNLIWGVCNNTLIALLMLVPIVNVIMPFVLGAKGNEWAWQNRQWRDVEHFRTVQGRWAITGPIVLMLVLAGAFLGIPRLLEGDAYQLALSKVQTSQAVITELGEPIRAEGVTSGQITTDANNGQASLHFTVVGPRQDADVYANMSQHFGQWQVEKIIVRPAISGFDIDVPAE